MIAYAVAVGCKDGTERLALAGDGNTPAVWRGQRSRTFAVQFMRLLQPHLKGHCHIVKVEYTEPRILEPSPS